MNRRSFFGAVAAALIAGPTALYGLVRRKRPSLWKDHVRTFYPEKVEWFSGVDLAAPGSKSKSAVLTIYETDGNSFPIKVGEHELVGPPYWDRVI
jgi:hypothetical protein